MRNCIAINNVTTNENVTPSCGVMARIINEWLLLLSVRMTTMAENREALVQKSLLDWWSEETEYVFQRIERWTVFARGYNRLRSQTWFKDRQIVRETRKSMSSDENLTRFHTFKRSRWKLHSEEIKINCCGTLNYQSNSKLDNNCLETYRYDHSIYFKTIGDIKNDKRDQNQNQDSASVSSEEQVEWDANLLVDPISNQLSEETSNILNIAERKEDKIIQNVWPIVDLSKFNLNLIDNQKEDKWHSRLADEDICEINPLERVENNNVIFLNNSKEEKKNHEDELKEKMSKLCTFQKTKKLSSHLQR
ncbi:hypothetical protein PUN28_010795 [Cardiocondyla obscurior]|uniref:Uncharacterized protein n=1 Tax=Cardiocondyla obscurior TaxID=286306 RepID=A0AAW2FNJ4_9HYME